jgi:hypothetical protein
MCWVLVAAGIRNRWRHSDSIKSSIVLRVRLCNRSDRQIEKRYAQEKAGHILLTPNSWRKRQIRLATVAVSSTCRFFSQWGLCSHTMALEQILKDMLPDEALTAHTDAQVR